MIAVERHAEDVRRIEANATEHGVTIEVVHGEAPGALEPLPDPDRVFVGGGGTAVLDAVLARLRPGGRVVATFAVLDRAAAAYERLGNLAEVSVSAWKAARRRSATPGREPGVRRVGAGVVSNQVLSVSVTEAGRVRARRLPFEHVHGSAASAVRERWGSVDGFVLFLATGAAVRIVAPLLADKNRDPAVVCVDEGGRYAVALVGGHAGGANALARQVGELLDAEPVLTTATDSAGRVALDTLPGFVATGDVAAVTATMLDGRAPPRLERAGLAAARRPRCRRRARANRGHRPP